MYFTVFNKENAKKIFFHILSILRDGKAYNILIEEVKRFKTHKQLKFFFGCIVKPLSDYYFSLGYGINEHTPYNSEMTKLIIYDEVGLCQDVDLPSGKTITEPIISLSKMTVEQASKFITAVIHWVDVKTDCILPVAIRYCWLLSVDDETIYRAQNSKFPNRDPSFLNHIRSQPCIYCGRAPIEGMRNEAHHVKGVFKDCPDIIPPDYCAVPACHNCHTGNIGIQYMPPERLEVRIPTFGFKMKLFLLLNYLRFREHR